MEDMIENVTASRFARLLDDGNERREEISLNECSPIWNEPNKELVDRMTPTFAEYCIRRNLEEEARIKSEVTYIQRNGFEPGVVTIISAKTSGSKVILSGRLISELEYPKWISISYLSEMLIIKACDEATDNGFKLKKYGSKYALYSVALVKEMTERLKLNYNEKVSVTLSKVNYCMEDDKYLAVISK
jgi:hypothetical protein